MTPFLKAVKTEDGYKVSDNGALVENNMRDFGKEIFTVLKTRERAFYPTQIVTHNGETYEVEKISRNGWVKFVGIKHRTRAKFVKPVNKEMESYYAIPTDKELVQYAIERLSVLLTYNVFDFFFNFKKAIKDIKLALSMV